MDYFRKYIGGQPGQNTPSGAETVERLCDRVQSSTLLEDRRDAVRALKSLSRKFQIEVGSQATEILIKVLETDRNDAEIIGYTLETLCNIMTNEILEEQPEVPGAEKIPEDIGIQFTEFFIKGGDNVGTLLSLLDEYDFHVRWPSVKLLTIILGNKVKEMQEIILANPMGISKLMDLLSDSREIIRNDALLLLTQLTKGNTNIQKIVAFENAFERLLNIVSEEGCSDGGIVVEDCLLLIVNLLKNNSSNQNFFKEGSYIQWLPVYFELKEVELDPQGGWSAQKVTNVHLMLQVIRTLVSPNNPQAQISACQKVMMACGLIDRLCDILMASGIPQDILTETIHTVSEVIRGNQNNQEFFASVLAPSTPPRPAIVVLLMSMVNERQPLVLRCAVLYCFESFLYKNELGQSQIIQTLLPSTAEVNTVTSGQLLCSGLFSNDSLATWLGAVALLHAIEGNATQKEQLLRVQLATSVGNPPVSLLQQCTNILEKGGTVQTRVGLLMLLCNWLANCPVAVTHFLHNPANVPFLISQVGASEGDELELMVQGLCAFLLGICVLHNADQIESYTKSKVRAMIEKRIGIETFTDKLSQVSKHESYSKAAKKPQLNYQQPSDVIFDYEFTRLFKKLETEVLNSVSAVNDDNANSSQAHSAREHDSIVLQYKELIREQDLQLNVLRGELSELGAKSEEAIKQMDELKDQLQQTKDQNSLLKASRGSQSGVDLSEMTKLQQEIYRKNSSLEEKDQLIAKLKEETLASQTSSLVIGDGSAVVSSSNSADSTQAELNIQRLSQEVQELQRKGEQKDQEVQLYKNKYEDISKMAAQNNSQEDSASNTALLTDRNTLSARVKDLEKQLANSKDTFSNSDTDTASTIKQLESENKNLKQQINELEEEKLNYLEEIESSKKENEEFMVLCEDQELKLSSYKERLKNLGETVEDDDDLDFDDDDDVEDD